MASQQRQMLQVLAALPEPAFESLDQNPTTRLDLELSIVHGDLSALSALCYAAWLAEEKGGLLADAHWQALAELADQAGERETLEPYWPARLVRPWDFAATKPSVVPDERALAAMKEQGQPVIVVAQALRDGGASEADAIRILRGLFGLSLLDAITLFRAP